MQKELLTCSGIHELLWTKLVIKDPPKIGLSGMNLDQCSEQINAPVVYLDKLEHGKVTAYILPSAIIDLRAYIDKVQYFLTQSARWLATTKVLLNLEFCLANP